MTKVISVENLSKRYVLDHKRQEGYTTLRDTLAEGAKRLFPRNTSANDPTHEEFWALRDISFDIQEGDRVGIIGRNGAGKSTLLKVLSRITEPTSGKVAIRGRVASLLEVGTGFHPELSGRENIFLNGAILGMSKAEIKKKFDEIVSFAEVEKFLDTPVKRYSSGMYVRLAFAVAAHLEPEILIVDEVLAVGDAQFQKKCLGKMEDVSKEGRTVLFVSHNMNAIQHLTGQCLALKDGRIDYFGDTVTAVEHYLADMAGRPLADAKKLETAVEDFVIEALYFNDSRMDKGFNQPIYICMELSLEKTFDNVDIGFGVVNTLGNRILTMQRIVHSLPKGRSKVEFKLEDHHLAPGNYSLVLGMGLSGGGTLIYQENVLMFELPYAAEDGAYLANKNDRIGAYYQPTCTVTASE